MQRVARFLLWGGLAMFLMGALSCGVGCFGAVDSTLGDNPESEELAGAAGIGVLLLIVSILMVIVGAVLRAIAGSPHEETR